MCYVALAMLVVAVKADSRPPQNPSRARADYVGKNQQDNDGSKDEQPVLCVRRRQRRSATRDLQRTQTDDRRENRDRHTEQIEE